MNLSQAALLASLSAISLPDTLKCPGTHISLTLFNNDSHLSSVIVSATSFDVVVAVSSAFSAAWLSEQIAIDASYAVCRQLTQAKIAYTSAWNIYILYTFGDFDQPVKSVVGRGSLLLMSAMRPDAVRQLSSIQSTVSRYVGLHAHAWPGLV